MNFAPSGASSAAGGSYAPATYQRLMRLAARAFYSGPCPPPGRDADSSFSARSKIAKMDTRGLGVVLIDYLTTVEWTSFELLTEALRLHPVVLSRALRFLEADHMVRREERRETRRKKRNIVGEALEADLAQAGGSDDDEEEENGTKKKGLLAEYFTLDYARAFDALQIRIQTMRASLKEQLDATNAIQAYRCPGAFCGKTYTSLDAANLVDTMDLTFKCEMCGSELLEQRATNDADAGAPQHATARESKEAARRLLQAIDRELAPITRLMADLQHRAVPLPDPGELFEWAKKVRQREADMAAAAAAAGGAAGGGGGGGGAAASRAGGAVGAAAGASGAPAAMLAGSGVTVLSAADNTNTWESQDFKVSLDGAAAGAGLGGGGGGGGLLFGGGAASTAAAAAADGGKKQPKMLPWFMRTADGKAGLEAPGADEGAEAASAAGDVSGGADRGKQQQQAEYFRDFMNYMSQLQQEKRAPPAAAPPPPQQPVAAPKAAPPAPYAAVKPEPGLAAPLGPLAAALAPAAPPAPLPIKEEPGVYGAAAAAAAAAPAASAGDVEWEDIGGLMPPPLSQQIPKLEDGVKTEPGTGFGGGGGMALDADGDVEWEDV